MSGLTAKLIPFAIKTTLETDIVPPDQGTTQSDEAPLLQG